MSDAADVRAPDLVGDEGQARGLVEAVGSDAALLRRLGRPTLFGLRPMPALGRGQPRYAHRRGLPLGDALFEVGEGLGTSARENRERLAHAIAVVRAEVACLRHGAAGLPEFGPQETIVGGVVETSPPCKSCLELPEALCRASGWRRHGLDVRPVGNFIHETHRRAKDPNSASGCQSLFTTVGHGLKRLRRGAQRARLPLSTRPFPAARLPSLLRMLQAFSYSSPSFPNALRPNPWATSTFAGEVPRPSSTPRL